MPSVMNTEDTEKAIQATLDKIRPFLRRDGGDIEYIGFRDGIAYVAMVGACEGCALANDDISTGVEIIVMEEVPGVMAVKANDVPADLMEAYLKKKEASNSLPKQ